MIRTAYLSSVGHDMAVAGCGRRKEPRWVALDELQACSSEGGRKGVLDAGRPTLDDTECVNLCRSRLIDFTDSQRCRRKDLKLSARRKKLRRLKKRRSARRRRRQRMAMIKELVPAHRRRATALHRAATNTLIR